MKKYYIFSILIYLIIAVCYSVYMSNFVSNMVFTGDDDIFAAFRPDCEGFLNKFIHIENGRYIINGLLWFFVVCLPHILHVHLNDFYNTFGAVFFLIVIQLTAISTTLIFILFNKNSKNILFSGIIALNGMGIVLMYIINNPWGYRGIQNCNTYYGYLLASLFGFLFIYIFYKYFLIKENLISSSEHCSKKYIVLCSILGFFAGCSSQIVAETVAVTVTLLIFYKLITKKITIKELFKEKIIIIPYLTFLIGLFVMVASPGFWVQVSWRHIESYSQLKEIFIPFCKKYVFYVLYKNILLYIVTFVLWGVIIFDAYINNRVRKALDFILITSFPLIGILLFYFLLILGGPMDHEGRFWVQEPFFLLPYYLVLQFVFASNIGYLLNKMKNIPIKYITFLFIPVITFTYIIRHEEHFKSDTYSSYDFRRSVYICEKIFTYQLYQNKNTIILPLLCDNYFMCTKSNDYMKHLYNIPEDLNVIVADDFEESVGYKIDEIVDEKELQKVKFQKLLDKDFVLNSAEHKI